MKKNTPLWFALIATLVATAWVSMNDKHESEVLVPTTRKAAVAEPRRVAVATRQRVGDTLNSQAESIDILSGWQRIKIEREPLPLFSANFSALSDRQKEQSPAAEMPALPFIYAGKLVDGSVFTVFLLAGERSLAVRRGDVLDEVWRVSEIRPPKMMFKYLPLKLEVALDIGESK